MGGMGKKEKVARAVSGFMREAAVLVAVFVPLDMRLQNVPFTFVNVIAIVAGVGLLLTMGILIDVLAE